MDKTLEKTPLSVRTRDVISVGKGRIQMPTPLVCPEESITVQEGENFAGLAWASRRSLRLDLELMG